MSTKQPNRQPNRQTSRRSDMQSSWQPDRQPARHSTSSKTRQTNGSSYGRSTDRRMAEPYRASGHSPAQRKRKKRDTATKKIAMTFIVVQIIFSIAFLGILFYLDILPAMYMAFIGLGLTILLVIPAVLIRQSETGRVISIVFSMIISCVLVLGTYYLWQTNQMLDDITDQEVVTRSENVSVIVLANDPAQSLNDTVNYVYGIQTSMDRENTDTTLNTLQNNMGVTLAVQEYNSLLDQVEALYNGEIGAMIMNEKFRPLVLESYESFSLDTKVLNSYQYQAQLPEESESEEKPTANVGDTFCVFLSGIDTEGSVDAVSRSDVNIIAAVNPKTKQILLLTTPRDYYVEFPMYEGCMDKLTHAGIYGIETSMETLENLYGIPIDYYARINFTGFKSVVNALGGVDVYCQIPFSAGGYSFSEGYNYVDGDKALVFVRERHAFGSGDIQRGRNQMEMIKALMDKIVSPSILTNYVSFMSSISDCFSTNMGKDMIADLVKMQLDDGAEWNIVSYNVSGSGTNATTYSMGSREVYVMIPDESTVETAKSLLDQVFNGETLSPVQ